MDFNETPDAFLFFDYGGLEEQECVKIQSILCSADSFIQLPCRVYSQQSQCYDGYKDQQYNYTINKNINAGQNSGISTNIKTNDAYLVPQTVYQQNYYQPPIVYAPYAGQGEPYPPQIKNVYSENPIPKQEPYINAMYPTLPVNTVNVSPSHSPIVAAPPRNVNYTVSSKAVEVTRNVLESQLPREDNYVSAHNNVQQWPVKKNEVPYKPVTNSAPPIQQIPDSQRLAEAASSNHAAVNSDAGPKTAPSNQLNNSGSTKVTNGVDSAPSRKSWASLFNKTQSNTENNAAPSVITNGCSKPLATVASFAVEDVEVSEEFLAMKEMLKAKYDDPSFYRMGEYLSSHIVDSRIISLQPRGLINRSNYCYINSILQAMLACPPVYNLLNGLAHETPNEKEQLPIISGMCHLVKEFHHLPATQRVGRRIDKNQKKDQSILINCDNPFEPAWIYKMLSGMRTDSFVIEGRQEDAEEFLGFLLNGLNDEMLDLIKLVSVSMQKPVNNNEQSAERQEEDKEWQVMGPKNKGSITRRTEFGRTPISDIFGGLLRSRVHRTGDQSTDNIQPFFTLQLNIEKVTSVNEALEALVSKNQLEGVTSSRTNEEVEAWQQVTIEELPIVLVLHLKCFDFKLDGCAKIIKALKFPIDLKVDNKLLSSKSSSSSKEKQYKLFAVVYHDGPKATKGHYITDAYHVGYGSWLRYDDASVKAVQEELVLKPTGTRVPYLLFYRRSDSIKSK